MAATLCADCKGAGNVDSVPCATCKTMGYTYDETDEVDPAIRAVVVDQPDPIKNDRPCIQDLVIKDIEARKAVGLERYGTLLQPFNGRDALMDAYAEALDLCQYLRQAIEERDAKSTAVFRAASAHSDAAL